MRSAVQRAPTRESGMVGRRTHRCAGLHISITPSVHRREWRGLFPHPTLVQSLETRFRGRLRALLIEWSRRLDACGGTRSCPVSGTAAMIRVPMIAVQERERRAHEHQTRHAHQEQVEKRLRGRSCYE